MLISQKKDGGGPPRTQSCGWSGGMAGWGKGAPGFRLSHWEEGEEVPLAGVAFLCPLSSGTGLSQPRPCHPCPTKHSSLGGVSNPSRVGGFLEAVLSSILFLCYPTPFLSLPAAITAPTPPSPFVVASRVTASILSGPSGSQM